MVVVKLRSWSVKVAVMEQQMQPSQHLLSTPTDQFYDPFGTNKAMLCDELHYLQIALGELK